MGWNAWNRGWVGLVFAVGACGGPSIITDSTDGTDGTDTTGTSGPDPALTTGPGVTTLVPDSTTSTTASVTTLAPDSSSGPPPSDSTSTGTDELTGSSTGSSTGSEPGSSSSSSDTGGVNPGGLPNGAQCDDDTDCFSDECFVAGALGGICGECTTDSDCAGGGCSLPNPITSAPAVCNAGESGDGCETSAVCADDLLCNAVLDIPGIFESSTCGECVDDNDCAGADTCQPEYDIGLLGGQWVCAAEDSITDGGGCSVGSSGDAACTSDACAEANFMSLFFLGVCSECIDDGDCPGASTCVPPEIDLAKGLVAGFCL